jgi:Domain of unknown function (DUF4407)
MTSPDPQLARENDGGPARIPLLPPPSPGDWDADEIQEPPTRSRAADHEADDDPSPAPVRMVIQGMPSIPPDSWTLRLARFMCLDGWGDFLLDRRVAYELGAAACILLVVLVFELLAWSLLFNVLVHSARWTISPRTLLACLMAGVFGGGVFLFERSFITADLGERPAKKVLAYLLRLIVIFGSCIATSQPVELLVFGGAIETRLRDENALAEAVRLVDERKRSERDAAVKSAGTIEKEELAGTKVNMDRDYYKTARDDAAKQVLSYQEQVQRDKESVAARSAEVGRRRLVVDQRRVQLARADAESHAELAAAVGDAEAQLTAARSRLQSARDTQAASERQLAEAKIQQQSAEQRFGEASKAYQARVDAAARTQHGREELAGKDRDELQAWMHDVEDAVPGKDVRRPKTGTWLKHKAADFTDRLRVLADLKEARPPQWPAADRAAVTKAADLFHLESPYAGEEPALRLRRQQARDLFRLTYWIAFIIAAVIPLLTLAFKLMASEEFRSYYSTTAQALAGNPDAIRALTVRGVRLEDLASPRVATPPWKRLFHREE